MHIAVPAHADELKQRACVGLVGYDGRNTATAYFSDGSAVDILGDMTAPRRRSRRKSPDLSHVAAGSDFDGPSAFEFIEESVAVVNGGRNVELRRTRFDHSQATVTSKTLLSPPGCQAVGATTALVNYHTRLTAARCSTEGSGSRGSRCDAIVVGVSAPGSARVYRHTLIGDAGITGLEYVKSARPGLLAASSYRVDPAEFVDGEILPVRISGRITLYDGLPLPDNESNRLISLADVDCVAECLTTGPGCLFAVNYRGERVTRYDIDGAEGRHHFVGETIGPMPPSRASTFSIAASGCGRYVAVGLTPAWADYGGEICVYDTASMRPMFSYETHSPPDVMAFHLRRGAIHPDLLSGHSDGTVYRWNLQQQSSFHYLVRMSSLIDREDEPSEEAIPDHVPTDPLGRAIDL